MTSDQEYRNGVTVGRMYAPQNGLVWYWGFFTGQWLGAVEWWWRQWR